MKKIYLAAAIAAVLMVGQIIGPANAQTKTLREMIVGTWIFGVAEVLAPDGKKSFPFGETPKGMLIFTPDGYFSQVHTIDKLTADEFVNTNPNVAGGRGKASNYYKRAK